MKFIFHILLLFYLGIHLASCSSPLKSESKRNKAIENLMDSLINKDNSIDALGIGIVYSNKISSFYAGKLLDGSKPNSKTQWEIASISKTFAGTLMAKALIEGKISLDEDIRDYLDEEFPNLEMEERYLTVRNLASHRSGLPLFFPIMDSLFQDTINWDILPFQFNQAQKDFTREDFLRSLQKYELPWMPGSKVMYSNPGSNLSAILLENVYQKPYDSLLIEEFFDPLKMIGSFPSIEFTREELIAQGRNANGLRMPFRVAKEVNAEGGIISTVEDMSKYMKYLLDKALVDYPILQEEIVSDTIEYHRGFFWQLNEIGDVRVLYQEGGAYGSSSYMAILLQSDLAIFIVSNVSGEQIHRHLDALNRQIINILKVTTE